MSGFCIELKFQAIKPISVKSPREVSTPTLKSGNEIRHWQVSLVGIGNLILGSGEVGESRRSVKPLPIG